MRKAIEVTAKKIILLEGIVARKASDAKTIKANADGSSLLDTTGLETVKMRKHKFFGILPDVSEIQAAYVADSSVRGAGEIMFRALLLRISNDTI